MLTDIIKKLAFLAVMSALFYLEIAKWPNFVFGAILSLLYFGYLSKKAGLILVHVFGLEAGAIRTRMLGIFFNLITLGWILGFIITFSRLTSLAIAIAFFVNGILYILADFLKIQKEDDATQNTDTLECEEEVPHAKVGVFIYIVLLLTGFYFLFASKSSESIASPWQVINPNYIYVFLLATLVLGVLILFTKLSSATVLFLVILHSLLLHSYLPLTHEFFYGADQWRHLGSEIRIANEQSVIEPKIIEGDNKPNYLGRLSYANFWGTSVVIGRVLNLDLVDIGRWMQPLASALILTILLYELGLAIGWGKRHALFFAWLGSLPFALQAGGSFTLPVNWGFLIWLALILLILKKINNSHKYQNLILGILGIGSVFGYALFFLLFWIGWAVAEIASRFKKIYVAVGALVLSALIPITELILGHSRFGAINWLGQLKQIIGNFSGFYLAYGPRPHDIVGGNVIFNQTPYYAFVLNALTQWRGWILLFSAIFFATIIFGAVLIWKFGNRSSFWIFSTGISIFVIYLFSFYFLNGEHIFIRRLDVVLGFFLTAMFFYGLQFSMDKRRIWEAVAVLILSVVIAASYSLGPDTLTVSKKQMNAMSYIWSEEKNETSPHCVLADTNSLLALEGISGKEIVGGGFPIDKNFAQPERIKFAEEMNRAINNNFLKKIYETTGADHCWFVGDRKVFEKQNILVGSSHKIFGDVAVIRYYSSSYLDKKYNVK